MEKIVRKIVDNISNLDSVSYVSIDFVKSRSNKMLKEEDTKYFFDSLNNFDEIKELNKPLQIYFKNNGENYIFLSISFNNNPNNKERRLILNMIEVIRNIILLHNQSRFDELTEVGNIKKLKEDLAFEIARGERRKTQFSLTFLDICDFKKINDSFGHEVGNEVLKNFSSFLDKNTRDTDRVYRYGGDEFILFLEDTSEEGSNILVNKLSNNLKNKTFIIKKNKLKLSFNYGVANFPSDGNTIDSLLNFADKKIIKNKVLKQPTQN